MRVIRAIKYLFLAAVALALVPYVAVPLYFSLILG